MGDIYPVDPVIGNEIDKNDVNGRRILSLEIFRHLVLNFDMGDIYPVDPVTGNEIYTTDDNGRQIIAKDQSGFNFYAKKKITLPDGTIHIIEYPPVNHLNKPYYFTMNTSEFINGEEVFYEIPHYPYNLTTSNPIYEKSKKGDEKYFVNPISKKEFYGKNLLTSVEVYAKDKKGDEILIDTDDYAKNLETNEEYYPRHDDGCEYYKQIGKTEIPAFVSDHNAKYAKDNLGNEIYPRMKVM